MENKFDYQSVPYGFAHCFNSQCVHKEECLHHLAATNCTSQCPTLSIINPNCIPADTTNCPHFRKALKCRVAWGIRHLLDNVPHKCAAPMRNQLVGHFGKTTYYRFYRQEQGLFPKAQAYIRQVFKQYGIAEEIREIQRRIQLQRLKHPDSSALTKFIFEKHLSCYHAEGDILLIINRLKRERYP